MKPPQTSIASPVQIAVWWARGLAAPDAGVSDWLSLSGPLLPPASVYCSPEPCPPQTIIRVPVQTALAPTRKKLYPGPPRRVGDQVSAIGSYCPPVIRKVSPVFPPQITMRE